MQSTPTAPAANHFDAGELPPRVDRATAAKIVTARYFPVSHRSLEVWPLSIRRVNGRALIETAELLAVAQAKLDAAPVIRTGQRKAAA